MQIRKAFFGRAEHPLVLAERSEQALQSFRVRARHLIGVPVTFDVSFLQTREMLIERCVIVFPVSLAQGQPHIKTDDPPHARIGAVAQNGQDIALRVVDKRQDRRQPYDGRYPSFPHFLQDLDPALRAAYIWFNDPAQSLIVCGERHLNNAARTPVDLIQQVDVLQDPIRLRLYGRSKALTQNDLQALSGQSELLFTMHIRIRHGSGPDHASFSLCAQLPLQKLRSVALDLNIFEQMGELITAAPAVTVDAAVRTAAVQIHPIVFQKFQ